MSSDLYEQLAWLPRAPADYSAQCRAGLEVDEAPGSRILSLARYGLDGNQLHKLAKLVRRAVERGLNLAPLIPFRLGIISNATADLIVPALIATAARHGFALDCHAAPFGQTMQEALSPASTINSVKCDAVLFAIDYRGLGLDDPHARIGMPGDSALSAFEYLQAMQAGIRSHGSAVCIWQTVARPPEPLFGNYDGVFPGTTHRNILNLNQRLSEFAAAGDNLLVDVSAIAEVVGLSEWHSPAQWNMAKLPFADKFVPLYADHVCRCIAALRGKSRKCLILDLDNTLWGGVIGDDGLDGIKIAQGDATGEAHLQLQKYALAMRTRGIVLAVSSKNTDAIARAPFQKHPEMLLREKHFAVFQANWNDKATNIRAIADELSLGLDAMVFVDDNPVERGLIQQVLPQVAVPELPADPALYARTVAAAGYFEAITFSEEDKKRADFYQDNARRVDLRKQAGDIGQYLASLAMEITFQSFDETGRGRIAQLINKSNQFNLTTRRYSEVDVADMQRNPDYLTLQVRLTDIYGDNGMISVVICRPAGPSELEIDTWLMSCRVLGRQVENAVLNELLSIANSRNIERLIGIYRPTPKNALVANHYQTLGFSLREKLNDGTAVWELPVSAPRTPVAMKVHRIGYAISAACNEETALADDT